MQARKWQDMGFDSLKTSVNLCARELVDEKTPQAMDDILVETGIDPMDLEIELTERQALEAWEGGVCNLEELRSWGISIALDDFGKGYSALSLLRSLPINRVKLDQVFLRGVPDDESSCTVVRSLVTLACALNIEVVAEGVETAEQAEFLCDIKCSAMQGFFYTASMSAEAATQWLKSGKQALRFPLERRSRNLPH